MVGATLADESSLARAAKHADVPGASVQDLVRLAILRVFMGLEEAKETVFGRVEEMRPTDGRAYGNVPQHEIDQLRTFLAGIGDEFADLANSQLVRIGLAILAGENEIKALTEPAMKRGKGSPRRKIQVKEENVST